MTTQFAESGEARIGYSSFEPDREERLEPGRTVVHDRYRIARLLGRGGVALVYEATDMRSGRTVALKVVTSKYADKSETAERYHNEARLAAAIGGHPNVVRPIEIGRIPEFHRRLYLTTELVHGRSLGKVLLHHTRGMPISRVCRIGRDVARAIYALHERGIVHRDIKPDNIMLELGDGPEVAKLLDFGFAYALGKGTIDVEASLDLTQAHERPGTPIYMAPEQAVGLRPTLAFDLYAFGASLYEMITGTAPYAGGSTIEVVQRKCALDDPPPAVELLCQDLPVELASLVARCLSRGPDDRPTIAAVLAELEQLCEAHDGATAGVAIASRCSNTETLALATPPAAFSAPAPVAARSGKTPRRALAVVALLLLGVVGLAAWFAWPTTRQGAQALAPTTPPHEDEREAPTPSIRTPLKTPTPKAPAIVAPPPPMEPANPTVAPPPPAAEDAPPTPPPSKPHTNDVTHPDKQQTRAALCRAQRSKASTARSKKKWSSVLKHTVDAGCWSSGPDRKRLRVEALFRLGRARACAKEARGSKDTAITAWRNECALGFTAEKKD